MAHRVGVLGAERRAEGIDAAQRKRAQLALELARDGKAALLAEEILRVIHGTLVVAGHVVQIERRHLEHRAGTLAVGGGDDRRVEVVEAVLVEELVDGVGHRVADAVDGAEGVRARAQVGDLAQELERVALLLQGVALGIGRAVDLDPLGLHLDALPRTGRGDQTAVDAQAGARGDGLELLLGDLLQVDHHLYVGYARSVVQGDESHVLIAALGAHPTFDDDVAVDGARLENFYDSLRFHGFGFIVIGAIAARRRAVVSRPRSGTCDRVCSHFVFELTKVGLICELSK